MARDLNPKCKQCRREGTKLFLKGERCFAQKCAMVKRKYPPGVHGAKRQARLSGYGIQLREKQKAKRIYGVLERQFSNYFKKAIGEAGDTGSNLLKLLELRLDNVVYRGGFASSRAAARQLVNHGHITVNGKRVDIPSCQAKVGDLIKVKKEESQLKRAKEAIKIRNQRAEAPAWLLLEPEKAEIKVVAQPLPEDLPQNINSKLIVEYYSR